MMPEGPDEARAREVLTSMQERLAEGPFAALGLAAHATTADIRHAFLELTKIYHPARFVRMSPELQRMSNEVFLALRSAHDSLAKPKMRSTAQLVASSQPAAPRPGSQPNPKAPAGSPRAPSQPIPRVGTPATSGTSGAMPRASTSPLPVIARAGTPSPAPPTSSNGTRPPQPAAPRSTPPSGLRAPTGPGGSTGAGTAKMPGPAASSSTIPVSRELAPIYDLLAQLKWDQARAQLNVLIARAAGTPNATRYQALHHYTRGREAQLERRLDEARVELDTALQLDPDLQLAKTALGELFTRRK
jgi:hypothetical protein